MGADWEQEEEEEEWGEESDRGAADEDEGDGIVRSGQVCVLGVPNSGKSSLVNALVGAKVSIVSPKPQTTRQRVLGIALLASEPGAPPDTQAVFFDTAGIMNMSGKPSEVGGTYRKRAKQLFSTNMLHKAMVKTAWKSTRDADALWWVLDAWKCFCYGDYMPGQAMLDGIPVGPPVRDSWWMHPEMEEELAFMRRIKKIKRPVHVVLNKMDLLQEAKADIERFMATVSKRLLAALGTDEEGEPLLQNLWPTSVLKDPESLLPLKEWLCDNLPERPAMYPVEALSDVPARVLASEITREKLFAVLRQELPYKTAVVNMVWRENDDGSLMLGQRIVVMTEGQERIVKGWLKHITEDAEKEISETLNSGRPVTLHFQTAVDPKWQTKQDFYNDVNGILLTSGSLLFPED